MTNDQLIDRVIEDMRWMGVSVDRNPVPSYKKVYGEFIVKEVGTEVLIFRNRYCIYNCRIGVFEGTITLEALAEKLTSFSVSLDNKRHRGVVDWLAVSEKV